MVCYSSASQYLYKMLRYRKPPTPYKATHHSSQEQSDVSTNRWQGVVSQQPYHVLAIRNPTRSDNTAIGYEFHYLISNAKLARLKETALKSQSKYQFHSNANICQRTSCIVACAHRTSKNQTLQSRHDIIIVICSISPSRASIINDGQRE